MRYFVTGATGFIGKRLVKALLARRGHRLERLDAREIARRFPAFSPGIYIDGYAHPIGGWVEAASAMSRLIARAAAAGVTVRDRCSAKALVERGGRTIGVWLADGRELLGDAVALCSGAWTAAPPARARA